jgi:hypothetical protein
MREGRKASAFLPSSQQIQKSDLLRRGKTPLNYEKGNKEMKKTNYDFRAIYNAYFASAKKECSAISIHMPRANKKTGTIPVWNILPYITCSCEAREGCGKEGCYAVKNALAHGYNLEKNSCLKAWVENTVYAIKYASELETYLDAWLTKHNPAFFRIHGSGDFFNVAYAEMWYRLAKNHPETKFLAFTKQWDIVRQVPFYVLDNFSLVLSGWTGINIPDDLREYYRCAWCDDGEENRIPADAIECPGHCDSCGLCWALKDIGRDTFFHKH